MPNVDRPCMRAPLIPPHLIARLTTKPVCVSSRVCTATCAWRAHLCTRPRVRACGDPPSTLRGGRAAGCWRAGGRARACGGGLPAPVRCPRLRNGCKGAGVGCCGGAREQACPGGAGGAPRGVILPLGRARCRSKRPAAANAAPLRRRELSFLRCSLFASFVLRSASRVRGAGLCAACPATHTMTPRCSHWPARRFY